MRSRRLNQEEKDFVQLIFDRNGCQTTVARRELLGRLYIVIVSQQPFTMVRLVAPRPIHGGPYEFYGFSKQCRYAKNADAWNEETGKKIALSRAVHLMCNYRGVRSEGGE